MRGVGREAHVERRARPAGPADRLLGEARVDVGRVVLRPSRIALQLPVVVDREAVVVIRGGVDAAVVVRPALGDLARVALTGLVEVLADVDRAIAGAAQPHRQRLGLPEAVEAAEREGVPLDAVVVGVLAAVVRRPRRTAERKAHAGGREHRAAPRDQPPGLGHDAHRPEVLVVGHDHDHVAPRGGVRAHRAKRERRQDDDRGRRDHPGLSHRSASQYLAWPLTKSRPDWPSSVLVSRVRSGPLLIPR